MLVCCDLLNRSVRAWIEGRLLRARLNPLVELHLIVSALWGHKFSSCWVSYWSERSNLKFGKTLQLSSPCKSFTWEMRCKSSIVQLLHLIVINVTYTKLDCIILPFLNLFIHLQCLNSPIPYQSTYSSPFFLLCLLTMS